MLDPATTVDDYDARVHALSECGHLAQSLSEALDELCGMTYELNSLLERLRHNCESMQEDLGRGNDLTGWDGVDGRWREAEVLRARRVDAIGYVRTLAALLNLSGGPLAVDADELLWDVAQRAFRPLAALEKLS